jgi:hypothetical protein
LVHAALAGLLGGVFEQGAEGHRTLFAQLVEGAPAGLGGRDRVVFQPVAVGVQVEVVPGFTDVSRLAGSMNLMRSAGSGP